MERNRAISVNGISKRFGKVAAVDNVSFDVSEGEFFGFLGPNGAGKTTLIRMLTTLLRPSSGSAVVACCDVARDPAAVRREIGVVPQAMTSDLDLTGYENMDIYGRFYGLHSRERGERISHLLEMVGLTGRGHDLVATYSGGMRRRLEIARVLVHRPKILFLDEPTIGLDPQSRHVVWDFLGKLIGEDSMTIFLTTHYMEEAETLCSRVAIIDTGKIIALGSPDELKAGIPGNDIITLTVTEVTQAISGRLGELPFVHKMVIEETTLRAYVDYGARNLPALMDEVRHAGGTVLSATVHEQSLEDVFIHYTGKSIRDEEAKKVSFFIGAGIPQKLGR
ncbi:MAG: ATP-binding cassette domain-containing protein [Nitrospiraceae bacterium]|nr:ATP-binding cassette domain-containing protein [Nitrospiraceae bacterium]